MRSGDLIGSAVTNTLRSKTRTLLTVLAIFVGAFTLTLTSGLGTGINRYIDSTVSGIGASDVLTVTKTSGDERSLGGASGPTPYDPDRVSAIPGGGSAPGGFGPTVTALTSKDIDAISSVKGVLKVEATRQISIDYVEYGNSTKYAASVGSLVPGQSVQLATGNAPATSGDELQLAIPASFVKPLGFSSNDAALGQTATIAVSDGTRTQYTVDAKIVGVTEAGLVGSGSSLVPSSALADRLWELQNTGIPEAQQDRYASASAWFDTAHDADGSTVKAALTDAGYAGKTVADQLGSFKAVIDGIVLVLNAFAAIALLAASFGIVNTLYMSVQERTREIGLMKAMGMGSGRVFSLFSLEAVFIGLLGSLIGAAGAIAVGSAISGALSGTLFSDLPGLTLIAFDPVSVGIMIVVVMGIAFLAGTLPAARAARKDPVEALRYE